MIFVFESLGLCGVVPAWECALVLIVEFEEIDEVSSSLSEGEVALIAETLERTELMKARSIFSPSCSREGAWSSWFGKFA